MTNFILKITLIVGTYYLSACNPANSNNTFTPVTAEDDLAVVYIYRPPVLSNAMYSLDLYINDKLEDSIKNGNRLRLLLKPDEYNFKIKPDKNYSGLAVLSLNLNAGANYFIRVDTTLKILSSTSYEPYKRSFNMINVEEKHALKEIAECCVTENRKTANKSEMKSIKKAPDEVFSFEKTQNPFSH